MSCQMRRKRNTPPEAPYKYTQHLTNYCNKFIKNYHNFNKIVMNDADYINKLCDNFSDILKETNYPLLTRTKTDKNNNKMSHAHF